MASPFVPVPVPMDRTSSAGGSKSRRPQRAASLGSVSSSSESSSPVARAMEEGCNRGEGCQRKSRCADRSDRSRTPPHLQNLTEPAGTNGTPEPPPDPAGRQEDRPITPTVLGYEVMEERAKFTVYKILVRKTLEESWVVFRRYADFSRLNDKLKDMFPGFRLALPPKRWFKDNYDSEFLEDRQLGLQAFLQNLVAHKDVSSCLAVREFLCLDDPPGPFDSLEESRAFCETLEESNYRLQKELLEKQKEITSLKRKLEERDKAILLLEKHLNGECATPSLRAACRLRAATAVQKLMWSRLLQRLTRTCPTMLAAPAQSETDPQNLERGRCDVHPVRSSACWCRPSLSSSPPVLQVTQLQQTPQH